MIRRIPTCAALIASLLMLGWLSGCNVAPGSDPLVVNAERTHKTAFEAVKLFLETDNDNRAIVSEKLPAVHQFAEQLRAKDANGKSTFEANFEAAWAAIQYYKTNRTQPSGDAMTDAINKISDLARAAQAYLVQMDEAGAKAKRALSNRI